MSEPLAEDQPPARKSKLPLLIGLVLAMLLGGGGFYAVYSGVLFGPGIEHTEESKIAPLPDIAFVPIAPMVISLGKGGSARHLRFTAQVEVTKSHEKEVTLLMPRILDVLNGYLRAVDVRDLEDPTALIRLRAQMLRRVQIVAGEGRVRDFLVTEFVLN
ncbi:flagellar basal body-associated protein FliL [Frigidibacter sp.]|uniref:flagellar basal body-associated FliL family protein n=1 Tax=Frigidibacter sp. TaxID=2586418 RepID=UPI002733543C|nr:flagellar basal body-associated FliL family protein [Frigidibacter sp.]MDP3341330.1 flagellar basal body-associated FliL family protein [Frigidibacter sp.]